MTNYRPTEDWRNAPTGARVPWTCEERAVDPFGGENADPSTYTYNPYDFDGTITGRAQPKVRMARALVGRGPLSGDGPAPTKKARAKKAPAGDPVLYIKIGDELRRLQ